MITIRNYNRYNKEAPTNRVISVTRELDSDFITLAEAKIHCRVDFTDEDAYIRDTLIPAARSAIENYTGLSLVPAEVTAILQNEISGMMLPWGPYVDSLVLKDTDENVIDSANYTVKGSELFQYSYGEITATYNAGYDEDTLPADLKLAILHQISFLYEKRGDGALSVYAKKLASPYKVHSWII